EAHPLAPGVAQDVLGLLAARGIDAWGYAAGEWRLRDADGPKVGPERLTLGLGPTQVDGFADVNDRNAEIGGVSDDHARLAQVESETRQLFGAAAAIQRSQAYYLDVTPRLANKGAALGALCRRIGVELGRTAVIGDMFNDVAMFTPAAFSIAMGQ